MMLSGLSRRRPHAGRTRLLAAAGALLISAVLAGGASAAPLSLAMPQSTAFAILGHSCGGIQEQVLATAFRPTTGRPGGFVFLQTRCGNGGRGGGTTTYTAWASVTWTFSGAVSSYTVLSGGPAHVNPTFTATDTAGDQLSESLTAVNVLPPNCTVTNTTYCAYRANLTVVAPGTPTGLTAGQVADQFNVAWTPDSATAKLVNSSTVTATPVGSSAPVLTATANGTAARASIGPLQPATTYAITVSSNDAGGSSAASSPLTLASQPATVVPAAPRTMTLRWTSPGNPGDALAAQWLAPVAGNSPIDEYEITVTASDPGGPAPGPYDQIVSGSTLSDQFAVDDTFDWSVRVRAHNAAGWGPRSAAVVLPASG